MGGNGEVEPPPSVVEAWSVTELEPLAGGRGEAFRAGELVFKPARERQTVWLAETLDRLATGPDLRVTRPVRSSTGRWVVDGWSAWRWLDGEHVHGEWDLILDVGARFHQAVAGVRWSPALVESHRWAVADRVAWDEQEGALPESVQGLVGRRRPVDLPSQLIHGDLAGNVLLHDALAPGVIDVSPYWRPPSYADAIVVADAVAWHGAGEALVEDLMRRDGDQLLLRAVLFRVAVDHKEVEAYRSVIELLEA